MTEIERYYSVAAVAIILDVSIFFVYDRIKDGQLDKVVELGTTKAKQRISASTLNAYIQSRTYSTKATA